MVKKKSRKKPLKPITPNSQITNMLRRCWLFSRERRERLRLDNGECWTCKSKIKPHVHHITPINMARIIRVIREEMLVGPEKLATFCKTHHDDIHRSEINLKPERETTPAQWVKSVKTYDRILIDEEIRG